MATKLEKQIQVQETARVLLGSSAVVDPYDALKALIDLELAKLATIGFEACRADALRSAK